MTETPRFKVHSSFIWLGGIQTSLAVLFFLVLSLFVSSGIDLATFFRYNTSGAVLIVAGAFVLFFIILGLLLLLQRFRYKHLWYELNQDEFSLYQGILSKKRVHVPYQRVQSVNQRASLTQRIFGVCTVHIDTAGGAQNKAVVVPYLSKSDAEWLRTQLFYRKQLMLAPPPPAPPTGLPVQTSIAPGVAAYPPQPGYPAQPYPRATGTGNVLDAPAAAMSDMRGVFGGTGFDLGAVSYSYGLSNKELVLTGMSNSSSFAVIVLTVLGALVTLGFTVIQSLLADIIGSEGADVISEVATGLFAPYVIGGFLVLVLFFWVVSVGGTCLAYGGFTARRRGSRIEVEHGILQHRFDGVDIDRVQSVVIRQSFIRRLIGYCELSLGKIDALTDAQKQNNAQAAAAQRGLMIHPFVKMSRVPEILAGLVPEYADVPTETIRLPKVALRRALLRRCIILGNGFWSAVIIAIIQVCLNLFMGDEPEILMIINYLALALYIICALVMAFDGVAAVLWYRRSGFAYNRHFMQVANGGFSFESVSFPRKKIQFGYVRSNPFQRLSKVMTINARTAAGIGGTNVRLVDVHEKEAQEWFDWLLPRRSA